MGCAGWKIGPSHYGPADPAKIYPAEGIAQNGPLDYNPPPMSANSSDLAGLDTAQRDRLLRRLVGCFAVAAFMAFGLAIATSVWQQAGGDMEPVSLAQDVPR